MSSLLQFLKRHFLKIYFVLLLPFYLYGISKYFIAFFFTLPFLVYAYKRVRPDLITSQIIAIVSLTFFAWLFFIFLSWPFLPQPIIKPDILGDNNFRSKITSTYQNGIDHKKIYRSLKFYGFKIKYNEDKNTYSAVYYRKNWVFCSSDYHVSWTVNEMNKITITGVREGSACV